MNTTSPSLLERLKVAAPGAADWRKLHDLYVPLVRHWLGRAGLGAEADDLAQEVFVVVFRELPGFLRRRPGSFRAWLRQVTVNRARTCQRAKRPHPVADLGPTDRFLAELEDPASDLSRQWDRDHDKHVFDKLLAAVRPDFAADTWRAFQLFAIDGRSAADTATATGLSENAVMLAKSRILKRLREEAAGLLD